MLSSISLIVIATFICLARTSPVKQDSFAGQHATTIFDLGRLSWKLSNSSGSITVPGNVPSAVHLDLYSAGAIDDPLYGINWLETKQDIAFSDWVYAAASPKEHLHKTGKTFLQFDGLDTFASISICGKEVGDTENQFRQYVFDVTQQLKSCQGEAHIQVYFKSAPRVAENIANVPNSEKFPDGLNLVYEIPHREYIRKQQCDFGWDWGPALSPTGIWKPAFLIHQEDDQDLHITNVAVDIYRKGQNNFVIPDHGADWILNVSLDAVGHVDGLPLHYVLVDIDSGSRVAQGSFDSVVYGRDLLTGTTELDASKFKLWWPNGLGQQPLYNLTVSVGKTESVTKTVGFRTIILNLGNVTESERAKGIGPGAHWHFEVNGQPFYAKGANLIPPDVFWTRGVAFLERVFDSVIDANMNMLRVWGGASVLPDIAYEIASRRGILLWSEFTFSDSMYPVDGKSLENVKHEIYYQVRRVNHYLSLSLWAGNNELVIVNLASLVGQPDLLTRFKKEFETLFVENIAPIVLGNTRSISYIPTSTSSGYTYINLNDPHPLKMRYPPMDGGEEGEFYSDTDHYSYDVSEAFDIDSYPVGRFANEFGFHSMPSLATWKQVLPEDQMDMNSSYVLKRNHHYPPNTTDEYFNTQISLEGMKEMTNMIHAYYPVPNKSDKVANFSAWTFATQVFQADYYRWQIMFYRVASGFPQHQLGSLYWQLNDIWQGQSWSSVEYDGRYKVVHNVAKDIYSNVIAAPLYNQTSGLVDIYAVSDLWTQVDGRLSYSWTTWNGESVSLPKQSNVEFTVGGLNSTRIASLNFSGELAKAQVNSADVILTVNLTASGKLPNSDNVQTFTHSNWYAPPLGKARLVDPGLDVRYDKESDGFVVTATKGASAWTWLSAAADAAVVNFEHNAFFLAKGESRYVGYHVISGEWSHRVNVDSIWSLTQ